MPKDIKRKKNAIHPNSRAAYKLARKSFHEQRIEKRYKEKATKLELLGEKLMWFHDHLDDGKTCYTKEEACKLVEQYLDRFNEELEQIKLKNSMKGRTGMQHVSRLQAIKMTLEKECYEFEVSGFEMPDVTNVKNLKIFREWSGELRYIQNIKMIKIFKACEKKSVSKDRPDTDVVDTKSASDVLHDPNEDTTVQELQSNG